MSLSPEEELERLRQEVESYRQRELEQLQARLAEAERQRDHYRAEAQRNADLGRQIHTESQAEIQSLRSQLDALRNAQTHASRFGR